PGIGEVRAQEIIEFRQEKGSFSGVEELTEINGIGPKTVSRIEDEVTD
ncbi:MAG: ComEA family DNA-binding protein, partial [Halanaerobiales bacterium]